MFSSHRTVSVGSILLAFAGAFTLILAPSTHAQNEPDISDQFPDFDGDVRVIDGNRVFVPNPGSEFYNWMMDTDTCRDNPEFAACEPDARVPLCLREPQFAVCEEDGSESLPGEELTETEDEIDGDLEEERPTSDVVGEVETLFDDIDREVELEDDENRNCARLAEMRAQREQLSFQLEANFLRLDEMLANPHPDWLSPEAMAAETSHWWALFRRINGIEARLTQEHLNLAERHRLEIELAGLYIARSNSLETIIASEDEDEMIGYGGKLRSLRRVIDANSIQISALDQEIGLASRRCQSFGE